MALGQCWQLCTVTDKQAGMQGDRPANQPASHRPPCFYNFLLSYSLSYADQVIYRCGEGLYGHSLLKTSRAAGIIGTSCQGLDANPRHAKNFCILKSSPVISFGCTNSLATRGFPSCSLSLLALKDSVKVWLSYPPKHSAPSGPNICKKLHFLSKMLQSSSFKEVYHRYTLSYIFQRKANGSTGIDKDAHAKSLSYFPRAH